MQMQSTVAESCCKMQAFEALIDRLIPRIIEKISTRVVARSKAVATSDLCFVAMVFLLLEVECEGTHTRVKAELVFGTTTGGETATTTVEVCETVGVIAPNETVLHCDSLIIRAKEVQRPDGVVAIR